MTRCKDCDGKGTYEIRNAYKPDFKKMVKCDTCQGLCYVNIGSKFSFQAPDKPVN
jgi:excinuclease UvrABC ATPase subunit